MHENKIFLFRHFLTFTLPILLLWLVFLSSGRFCGSVNDSQIASSFFSFIYFSFLLYFMFWVYYRKSNGKEWRHIGQEEVKNYCFRFCTNKIFVFMNFSVCYTYKYARYMRHNQLINCESMWHVKMWFVCLTMQ